MIFVYCFYTVYWRLAASEENYTTSIGSNIAITLKNTLESNYAVYGPSTKVLYNISPSGKFNIGVSTFNSKYSIDTNQTNVINITVKLVTQSDAGRYRIASLNGDKTESSAFLIVTDVPKTPQLFVQPQPSLVGDNITFTCRSSVQRWPENVQTILSYRYQGIVGIRKGDNLIVKDLSRRFKGLNVTCRATDDLGFQSAISNMITLDPYYSSTIKEVEVKLSYLQGKLYSFPDSKNLEISLVTEGNPDPSVYFYKAGTNKSTVTYIKNGTTYTLRYNGIGCEDSGHYILEASNGVKNHTSIKKVQLDSQYLCKPIEIQPEKLNILHLVGGALIAVILILLTTNIVCLYKCLKGRKTEQPTVYVLDELETDTCKCGGVASTQVQDEQDYVSLKDRNHSRLYDEAQVQICQTFR